MDETAGPKGKSRARIAWIAGGAALVALVAVLVASPAFASPLAGMTSASAAPSASGSLASGSTQVSVHSHAYALNTGPDVTTPDVSVAKNSVVVVFVGYVNSIIGGGVISSITSSANNVFHRIAYTGYNSNKTEAVYFAKVTKASSSFNVTVSFTGGDTVMGGTVALIDVTGVNFTHPIGPVAKAHGISSVAVVGVSTTLNGEFYLFGTVGRGLAAPFTGGTGEHLLDTSGGDVGPFADGVGFATFSCPNRSGTFGLAASLYESSNWEAVAVGINAA